jgi:hypothetical protein
MTYPFKVNSAFGGISGSRSNSTAILVSRRPIPIPKPSLWHPVRYAVRGAFEAMILNQFLQTFIR